VTARMRATTREFCIWLRHEGRQLGVDSDGVDGLISGRRRGCSGKLNEALSWRDDGGTRKARHGRSLNYGAREAEAGGEDTARPRTKSRGTAWRGARKRSASRTVASTHTRSRRARWGDTGRTGPSELAMEGARPGHSPAQGACALGDRRCA
jgi:hypothetical protein